MRPASLLAAAALGALAAGAPVARAQDAAAKACYAKAASTYDTVQCQKTELAGVEAQLKTAYEKAMATLPPDQKGKLLEAERRWIAFREADCGAYYGRQTGTIASVQGGVCMIQHAKDRIRDLATFSEP